MNYDGAIVSDQQRKIELIETSLSRTVQRLESAGHEVVFIHTLPNYFGEFAWDPASCTLSAVLSGCSYSMPLKAAQERTAAVRQAIGRLGARVGPRIVDLSDDVCPDGLCVSQRHGRPIFRDDNHISVPMSRSLGRTFSRIISDSR